MGTEVRKFEEILSDESIKQKFIDILKANANSFTANLAVIVSNSDALSKCEPMSIIRCAVEAASMGLQLSPGLGQAAIVPYFNKGSQVAQFQIMYKGLIQLCIRSGQYATISATEIYEGQLVSENPLTGFVFDFTKKRSETIIGYAAYFKLLNGFEKTVYATVEKLNAHGKRFSKTYQKNYGQWVDDFHAMCLKTITKMLLDKWGAKSIEMQKAIRFDQASVSENGEPEYVDVDNLEDEKKKLPAPELTITDNQFIEMLAKLPNKPVLVLERFNTRQLSEQQKEQLETAVSSLIKELSYDIEKMPLIDSICEKYPVQIEMLTGCGLMLDENGKVKQAF